MTPVLLFDADCGFCTRSAGWLRRLRPEARIEAMQRVDLAALGVAEARAGREIPFVADDGAVVYGPAAIAAALRTCPPPWSLVGRILGSVPVGVIARPVYAVIARCRHRLPGGTSSCRLD